MMIDCEQLITYLVTLVATHSPHFNYLNRKFDLTLPWPRWSVAELFEHQARIQLDDLISDHLIEIAENQGYRIDPQFPWDDAFQQIFSNQIQPFLAQQVQPIFVCDYPVQQAALAKKKASDPRLAERFELYWAGIELANAFSELVAATEQKSRLIAELSLRRQLGRTSYKLDEDFIAALASGLPPSAGIALGVDRLVAVLTNS